MIWCYKVVWYCARQYQPVFFKDMDNNHYGSPIFICTNISIVTGAELYFYKESYKCLEQTPSLKLLISKPLNL